MKRPFDGRRRLLLSATGALALGSVAVVSMAKPKERTIAVVAKKFVWLPAEIHVAKGETVTLQFTAPEVPMGFSLPDYKMRTDIIPGKMATLKFTADKVGKFGFLCDLFCGSGHEDMQGTLIVT